MNKREIINGLLDWSAKFAYIGSTVIYFSHEPYPDGDLITANLYLNGYAPFTDPDGGPWCIEADEEYEKVEEMLSKEYELQLKSQITARSAI